MKIAIVLNFVICSFVWSAHAGPTLLGNEGAHAGDAYGAEFRALSDELIKELDQPKYSSYLSSLGVSIDNLKKAVKGTIPYSDEGEKVKINGQEVDAINFYPHLQLLLHRARWRSDTLDQKLRVVWHEVFGLVGVELDIYDESIKLPEAFLALYRRLLKDPQGPVRYYGRDTYAAPLYARNADPCDLNNQALRDVIQRVTQLSLSRCQQEQGVACISSNDYVLDLVSSSTTGFNYCEVTVVSKPGHSSP